MVSVLDAYYLGISGIVTVAMQLFFWSIANALKFDKVTDIAGSMNFVVIAWLTFLLSGTYYTRQIVILAMVTVWGARLGLYLLTRVIKRGKDERFDEMRENFWSFLGFWVFQMIWVFTVSLSVIFVQSSYVDVVIGARDIIGWILWSIGFVVEALADSSKSAFNDNPANKGRLLQDNVWYYSRHPNYFGEIVIWLGLFLSASSVFSANTNAAYVSVLSPIMTFIFLAFLSGIPPAEERYDKRFGSDPIYIDYKVRTSPLIPFPPQWYRVLPTFIKLLICLELPMYSQHFRQSVSRSLHSGTPPSSKIATSGVV